MDNARAVATRLADLLHREHLAMADFLVALAHFDRRRGWAELGHASLFDFLRRELGLSAGAAQYRKTAAALLNRFSEVEAPLRDGRLCLMSVCELARVLTEENRAEVLPRFFGLSRREAQEVAVGIRPEAAPRREVITAIAFRPVPAPFRPVEAAGAASGAPMLLPPPSPGASRGLPAPAAVQPSSSTQPLTAGLSRFHATVPRRFLEKLEAARSALSHSHPGADAVAILEAGLDELLAKAAKRSGLVKKPRALQPVETATSTAEAACAARGADGYIPAAIRREVWIRDGGRCTWPLEGGGRCDSTLRVELDHVVPRGRGGATTTANLRCLCKLHNQEAARRVFGADWMEQFARGGRSSRQAGPTTHDGKPVGTAAT